MKRVVCLVTTMLATPVMAAEIQPVDGTWRHDIQKLQNDGCPAHLLAPETRSFEYKIDYPKPYHLTGRQEAHTIWKQVGENQWHGTKTVNDADSSHKAVTTYDITVHSDTHITQKTTMTLTVPTAVAKAHGMKSDSCTYSSILEQHFQGR